MIKTARTKLMEAYINLIGDFLIDSMSAPLLKEELEAILDEDLTVEDFHDIIKENARVYDIYMIKYKPHDKAHYNGYLQLGDRKVGEISMEARKDKEKATVGGIRYI